MAESRQFAFSVFILLVILNICSIERQATSLKIYFAKLPVWNNFSGFANTLPSILWVLSFHTLCIYVTQCRALIALRLATVPSQELPKLCLQFPPDEKVPSSVLVSSGSHMGDSMDLRPHTSSNPHSREGTPLNGETPPWIHPPQTPLSRKQQAHAGRKAPSHLLSSHFSPIQTTPGLSLGSVLFPCKASGLRQS